MKTRTKFLVGAGLVAAILFGNAASAYAYGGTGTRYCPSGRTVSLGSEQAAGYVYHQHDNINTGTSYAKDWPNATGGWKWSGAYYQNVNWRITTTAMVDEYNTICSV